MGGLAARVQRSMVDVVLRRTEILKARAQAHPWGPVGRGGTQPPANSRSRRDAEDWAAQQSDDALLPLAEPLVAYAPWSVIAEPFVAKLGVPAVTLPLLVLWAEALRWPERLPPVPFGVTWCELVVDFELFTRSSVPPAGAAALPLEWRGKALRLRELLAYAEKVLQRRLLPTTRTNASRALVPDGLPKLAGLRARPRWAGGPETRQRLQRLLASRPATNEQRPPAQRSTGWGTSAWEAEDTTAGAALRTDEEHWVAVAARWPRRRRTARPSVPRGLISPGQFTAVGILLAPAPPPVAPRRLVHGGVLRPPAPRVRPAAKESPAVVSAGREAPGDLSAAEANLPLASVVPWVVLEASVRLGGGGYYVLVPQALREHFSLPDNGQGKARIYFRRPVTGGAGSAPRRYGSWALARARAEAYATDLRALAPEHLLARSSRIGAASGAPHPDQAAAAQRMQWASARLFERAVGARAPAPRRPLRALLSDPVEEALHGPGTPLLPRTAWIRFRSGHNREGEFLWGYELVIPQGRMRAPDPPPRRKIGITLAAWGTWTRARRRAEETARSWGAPDLTPAQLAVAARAADIAEPEILAAQAALALRAADLVALPLAPPAGDGEEGAEDPAAPSPAAPAADNTDTADPDAASAAGEGDEDDAPAPDGGTAPCEEGDEEWGDAFVAALAQAGLEDLEDAAPASADAPDAREDPAPRPALAPLPSAAPAPRVAGWEAGIMPDFDPDLGPSEQPDPEEDEDAHLPPELEELRRAEDAEVRSGLRPGAAAVPPPGETLLELRRLPPAALVPRQELDPRRHPWCVPPLGAPRSSPAERRATRLAGQRHALFQGDPVRPEGRWIPERPPPPEAAGVDALGFADRVRRRQAQAAALGVPEEDLPPAPDDLPPPSRRRPLRLHARFPSLAPGAAATARPPGAAPQEWVVHP
jgi:hypothetical protein